jgi:hypothetical protein
MAPEDISVPCILCRSRDTAQSEKARRHWKWIPDLSVQKNHCRSVLSVQVFPNFWFETRITSLPVWEDCVASKMLCLHALIGPTTHKVFDSEGLFGNTLNRDDPGWSCFSSPKFARAQDWRFCFWDQNLCILFDAYSPISLTGIDKIKHLSIIYIYIIFLIFIIHQASRPWLKVEVIHATKWWCARLSGMS